MLTLALIACSADPIRSPASPTSPPAGPVLVLPDEHPVALRAAEGWRLADVQVLGDLDADGVVDFRVRALDGELPVEVVVHGPLGGQVLPRDEWFVLDPGGWIHEVGDVDGDGLVDLLWEGDEYGLVLGPIDGPPAPGEVTRWTTGLHDVDRDGILDQVESTHGSSTADWPEQLEVTWGPLDRFDGPPDVVVGPLCRDGYDYEGGYWDGTEVFAPGDLDADGEPELSLGAYGRWYGDCGEFTTSLPRSGAVDPFVHDRLVADVVLLGDVTGDELPEVLTASSVVASPIDLAPGTLTGSDELALAPELVQVFPSATGPLGVWDVLGTRVVAPIVGLAGFGSFEAESGWEIGRGSSTSAPFVEDGRVKLVLVDGDLARLADLGPAD